jgi:hypothetical protein
VTNRVKSWVEVDGTWLSNSPMHVSVNSWAWSRMASCKLCLVGSNGLSNVQDGLVMGLF